MEAPSTKGYVLVMLALLMASHVSFLGYGASACAERSRRLVPGDHTGEVCQTLPKEFQGAVETYLAVLLALLAPIGRAD